MGYRWGPNVGADGGLKGVQMRVDGELTYRWSKMKMQVGQMVMSFCLILKVPIAVPVEVPIVSEFANDNTGYLKNSFH